MKKVYLILICISVVMISVPCLYAEIRFSDDFSNTNKISYKSNIKITNGQAIMTNTGAGKKGILISTIITRASNETWDSLTANGNFTNSTSIIISVLDTNNSYSNNLGMIDDSNPKKTFYKLSQYITNRSIKLKAKFVTPNISSPELTSWEVTVKDVISGEVPGDPKKFYGFPSPFIIESQVSLITFKYSTESSELQGAPITKTKPGKVTLTILDLNNNLVKTVCDNKQYPLSGFNSSWFGEEWDGKNGNGIAVMSGAYIAKLEITYDDGTKPNITPFRFAVIR